MLSYCPYSSEWPEAYGYWERCFISYIQAGSEGKPIDFLSVEFFLPIQAAEHCLTLGSSIVCTTKSVRHRAPFMELPHWTSWEKPGVQSLRKILRCRLISSSVWLSGYLWINPFIEPFQGELESRVSSNSALKCGAPGFRFNIPIYCWPSRFPYGAYHKVSCPLCFFSWMFAGMSQSFHVIYEQPRGKKSCYFKS